MLKWGEVERWRCAVCGAESLGVACGVCGVERRASMRLRALLLVECGVESMVDIEAQRKG